MMADRGMTITKSLTYTFGMTLAFPCASLCMMYALERFGRKPTSIVSFVLAGAFAVAFVNATSDTMLLAVGFCMIFFIQLAGNSMQIFASEVFPTNARASGFGFAQGAGRLGDRVHHPGDPVDPDRLRHRRGVRLRRGRAGDRRLHGQAARPGVARRAAGRAGAADRRDGA